MRLFIDCYVIINVMQDIVIFLIVIEIDTVSLIASGLIFMIVINLVYFRVSN